MIFYDQISIQKTSPLPSLRHLDTTIINMTSNLFHLDSPSVSVPTHNVGPNPLPISNLNPPLNNNSQQPNNTPTTSQFFPLFIPLIH